MVPRYRVTFSISLTYLRARYLNENNKPSDSRILNIHYTPPRLTYQVARELSTHHPRTRTGVQLTKLWRYRVGPKEHQLSVRHFGNFCQK